MGCQCGTTMSESTPLPFSPPVPVSAGRPVYSSCSSPPLLLGPCWVWGTHAACSSSMCLAMHWWQRRDFYPAAAPLFQVPVLSAPHYC